MTRPRISKAEFEANCRRDTEARTVALEEASRTLSRAAGRLMKIAGKGSYTMREMQEIRREVLRTVRWDIDPFAHPVMPDERHY